MGEGSLRADQLFTPPPASRCLQACRGLARPGPGATDGGTSPPAPCLPRVTPSLRLRDSSTLLRVCEGVGGLTAKRQSKCV